MFSNRPRRHPFPNIARDVFPFAATSVVAVHKVLDWAVEAGADRDKLLAVMHDSSGQTWFCSNYGRSAWAAEAYDVENTIGILERDVLPALDGVAPVWTNRSRRRSWRH